MGRRRPYSAPMCPECKAEAERERSRKRAREYYARNKEEIRERRRARGEYRNALRAVLALDDETAERLSDMFANADGEGESDDDDEPGGAVQED